MSTQFPIRMVRRAETNLGDSCADALLHQTGADVAMINGGGIRVNLEKGDISYGDILSVFPFNNQVYVIEATGQQILDALEWGAREVPGESGAFLQVAGISYQIDISVESGCQQDESEMMAGISGQRRVKNVTIGGDPIKPEKTYKLAGLDYFLIKNGDGHTAFDGCKVILEGGKLDNQMLMDYIKDDLGGTISGKYEDPYGEGRIIIVGQ